MGDHYLPVQNNPLPSPKSPHIITIRDASRKRGSKDLSSKTGIYKPLNGRQIRLLTLLPGETGPKICCSLKIVTLSGKLIPKYEALSYVWGEPQFSRLIWVNEKVLPVTTNLYTALENLRYPDKPRVLWIDAICINQNDLIERSEQVLLMKEIYRDANQVLIWLGLQDPDSDLAFDLLESVYTVDDESTESMRKRKGWGITTSKDLPSEQTRVSNHAEFALNDLQSHHMGALWKTFSQRSWWKRIWIIQEAVYARDVAIVCGRRSVRWELLERFIKSDNSRSGNDSQSVQLASSMETAIIIATLRNVLAIGNQKDKDDTGRWYKYSHRMLEIVTGPFMDDTPNTIMPTHEKPFKTTLDSLMVVFETSACTDPRDRIYGLLSLADNTSESDILFDNNSESNILPDYTKSPYAIFEEATRFIFNQSGSPDLLAYVHRSAQSNMSTKVQGQPSWVPDFAAAREYSTLISSSAPSSLYNSSFGYHFDRRLLNNCTSFLRIRTIECDLITEVLRTVDIYDPDWKRWFREWEPPDPDSLTLRGAKILRGITRISENKDDIYWRTLMLDITRPVGWPARISGRDVIKYRQMFANWSSSQLAIRLRDADKGTPASNLTPVDDFEDILGDHLHGWSLCRTSEGGRLGWMPNVAREGDTIHVAAGCSLPLILRRKDYMYQLVGTAYVHGIMDGEIVTLKWHERDSGGKLESRERSLL